MAYHRKKAFIIFEHQANLIMKHITLLLLHILLASSWLLAQDVILKKNGDELNCKVLEVGSSTINYTQIPANDSIRPEVQTIAKTEVFMIRYANGSKDVFNATPEPDYVKTDPIEEIKVSDNIGVEGRKFYYHNRRLGKSRLYSLLRNEKNAQINSLVSRSIVCSVFAPVLKIVSIPCGVVGLIVLGISSNTYNDITPEQKTLAGAGVAVLVLGQAGGYTVEFFQYKNLKEAVALYNQKHP